MPSNADFSCCGFFKTRATRSPSTPIGSLEEVTPPAFVFNSLETVTAAIFARVAQWHDFLSGMAPRRGFLALEEPVRSHFERSNLRGGFFFHAYQLVAQLTCLPVEFRLHPLEPLSITLPP